MSSLITPNGDVHPPLNIAAPAPIINLRGFKWRTVDEKLHAPAPSHEHEDDQASAVHAPVAAEAMIAQDGDAVPAIRALAAPAGLAPPQLPLSAAAFSGQLPGQLGHIPGLPPPPPPPFPLTQFQGAYAGNGFNMIFRPRPNDDNKQFPKPPPPQPNDNILELNLTTEQLTFGGTIGDIPNRGLNLNNQPDIFLQGLPYLQTIQDVTNIESGKGDSPIPSGIHFEPGMWLFVPNSDSPKNAPSVVRMASIPHGTTINAQGFAPTSANNGPPKFDLPQNILDTTPFNIGKFTSKIPFPSMDATNQQTARLPQNLKPFSDAGTINTDIIKNPNLVLKKAIDGQDIRETIVFEVTTGPTNGPTSAKLNGGGTANISFLAGTQNPITTASPGANDTPNAHAAFMTARFWIETVAYTVNVPRLTTRDRFLLRPVMPKASDGKDSTAPTPVFVITPPQKLPAEAQTVKIAGIQIQYSQTVNLNFATLTWPHVSVATLVPSDPQPFTIPG